MGEMRERQKDYYIDLKEQEKAVNTIRSYRTDIQGFIEWMSVQSDAEEIIRNDVIAYKDYLRAAGKETSTINRKVVSINKFLKWAGAEDAAGTKQIKKQKKATLEDVITMSEYERLLDAALEPKGQAKKAGMKPDAQIWAILQTITNTGIRFDELQYFTVEALRKAKRTNSIIVYNKGKERSIPVKKSLNKLLTEYCKDHNITEGYIFGTRYGNPISNEQVSRRLKKIAGYARIPKDKVHPHNFRHLFAKTYMETVGRLDKLQSILGHEDISTTTIYTKSSSKEIAEDLESLDLIREKPKTKNRKGSGSHDKH